jgi:hypothetical protein
MSDATPWPGSRALGPVDLVAGRLDPGDGDGWRSSTAWCGLTHLTELVSLDTSVCEPVTDAILVDDWPYIVNADLLVHFFVDLDYLLLRCGGVANRNLPCACRAVGNVRPAAVNGGRVHP